jgi:methylmalonyl-CoA/ethylmalonyl-CoA epimerase
VNAAPGAPSFEFHHVGVACTDIHSEVARMAPLGYTVEGEEFTDLHQGVRGLFLIGQSPRLELLEPLSGTPGGVLAPWLKQGVKLYHLAYVVRHLRDAVEHLRAQRGKLIVPPVPAAAFGGREIAFLMLPNHVLVELIASE